jgi:hypothetical protein
MFESPDLPSLSRKKGADPGGAVSLPEMQNAGCKMRGVMSAPTDVGGYAFTRRR